MIQRILVALLALFLIGGGLLWLYKNQKNLSTQRFYNPFAVLSGNPIDLNSSTSPHSFIPSVKPIRIEDTFGTDTPAEPGSFGQGVSNYGGDSNSPDAIENSLIEGDQSYSAITQQLQDAREFGEPSEYKGRIMFSTTNSLLSTESSYLNDPSAQSPGTAANAEQLTLVMSGEAKPIAISGWSLVSLITNRRAFIPYGTRLLQPNSGNQLTSIVVTAGTHATLSSGHSPVGVSYLENICTDYLHSPVSDNDTSSLECPDPQNEMPSTVENRQLYGDDCVSYVHDLPQCTVAAASVLPQTLSPACRSFIAQTFSYNGCVALHSTRPGFSKNSWQIFLNANQPLWVDHDVIRLVDGKSKTVDLLRL